MREGDGHLVRAGPSGRGCEGGAGERETLGGGGAVADGQLEQGGRAGVGPDVLAEPHRQHAAAHVEGGRARRVERGSSAVGHDGHCHAAGAAGRRAVAREPVARQVGREPVAEEQDGRRAEPEQRRRLDGLGQGGPLVGGYPGRDRVAVGAAGQDGVARQGDAVPAVPAGRAVEHGNVRVRDGRRGGRGRRRQAVARPGRGGHDGLVKVDLDRARLQVQDGQYGRRVDRRRGRVRLDRQGHVRGRRRRVAGQVAKGAGGQREERAVLGAGLGQGGPLAVREQHAHRRRRRRQGLFGRRGQGAACLHVGPRQAHGRVRGRDDRRAGQVDSRRVRVLVKPHGQQAVVKVQDGGRARGAGGADPRPHRVGRDEQARAVEPRKVVVRRVVHRARGDGQLEVAVGEQRELCALGLGRG